MCTLMMRSRLLRNTQCISTYQRCVPMSMCACGVHACVGGVSVIGHQTPFSQKITELSFLFFFTHIFHEYARFILLHQCNNICWVKLWFSCPCAGAARIVEMPVRFVCGVRSIIVVQSFAQSLKAICTK